MSIGARGRPPLSAIVVVTALAFLVTACGPADSGLGGDPCLLQQYQSQSYSITHHMDDALNTLVGQVDALSSSSGAITASPDISETLTDLREFQLGLRTQLTLLKMGAQPPEGRAFLAATRRAADRFNTGAQVLAQAYNDAAALNTRAALTVAAAGREWMRQGRVLLDQANADLAGLKTYSTNC